MKKIWVPVVVAVAAIALGGTIFYFSNDKNKENDMTIKTGSKVGIHYTLKVDGEVVDSSEGKDPLSYTQGSGDIISGLDKQLLGLKTGDKKSVSVSPEEGYGLHDERLIQKVPKSAFQDAKGLTVGEVVSGKVSDRPFQATVTGVSDNEITIDLNHPLSGKTLNFDVEIVSVQNI